MANYFTSSLVNDASLGLFEDRTSNSPMESVDGEKGLTATVVLRCPWANRDDVVDDILGNNRPYPRFTTAGCRAKTASMRGEGTPSTSEDGSILIYEHALITVNYTQGEEENEDEEIFSESLEPNAEFITNDYRRYRWGSASGDRLAPEEAPGKLIVGFDYVQTRYKLPSLPSAVLTPNICNSGSQTASLLGLTFPAQTLLYLSSQPQRTITTGGTTGWTMTSRFSYRKDTWNKFWRSKTGAFESMYLEGGSVHNNVPTGSFASILV